MDQRDRPFPIIFPLFSFLILMALFLQSACSSQGDNTASPTLPQSPPSQPDISEKTRRIPVLVETVEANFIESAPDQLNLTVTGNFQDGCTAPLKVEQERNQKQIDVTLYRELDVDLICPSVLVPFQEVISLDGEFLQGTYTLDVNGVIIEAKI